MYKSWNPPIFTLSGQTLFKFGIFGFNKYLVITYQVFRIFAMKNPFSFLLTVLTKVETPKFEEKKAEQPKSEAPESPKQEEQKTEKAPKAAAVQELIEEKKSVSLKQEEIKVDSPKTQENKMDSQNPDQKVTESPKIEEKPDIKSFTILGGY